MTQRSDFSADFDAIDPATERFGEADDFSAMVGGDAAFEARVSELLEQRLAKHNVLVALRTAAGLTQEEVAEAWGRAQPHVSRIERSELTNVPLRSLASYLEALGGSMHVVFELRGARIEMPCSATGELSVERTLSRRP